MAIDATPLLARQAAEARSRRSRRMPGIPKALAKAAAPLRKLMDERASISLGLRADLAERNRLAMSQTQAIAKDREAMAAALRAGEADPPSTVHEQERLFKLGETDRRTDGRRLAMSSIDAEMERLRRKAGPGWAEAAGAARAAAHQAALDAVGVLEAAIQTESGLRDFADWALGAPGQPATPRLRGVGNSMNPVYPADALRALRRWLTEADAAPAPADGKAQGAAPVAPMGVMAGMDADNDDGD